MRADAGMPKRTKTNPDAPWQLIPAACRITGLSQSYLRAGVKANTIPHIVSGSAYYINIPRLLEQLDRESMYSIKGGGNA